MTHETVYKPDANSQSVYTLTSTQPLNSQAKGQKITFKIVSSGVRTMGRENQKVQQPFTNTLTTSVNTGQSKTIAWLRALLRDGFQRFAAGNATPGQEFGVVGDARYGGELRLVAEDADTLRFDYTPKIGDVIRLKRIDVEKFAELLAQ